VRQWATNTWQEHYTSLQSPMIKSRELLLCISTGQIVTAPGITQQDVYLTKALSSARRCLASIVLESLSPSLWHLEETPVHFPARRQIRCRPHTSSLMQNWDLVEDYLKFHLLYLFYKQLCQLFLSAHRRYFSVTSATSMWGTANSVVNGRCRTMFPVEFLLFGSILSPSADF